MPGLTHSVNPHFKSRFCNKLSQLSVIAFILVLAGFAWAVPVPQDVADRTAQDWSYLHGWHLKQAGWQASDESEPTVQFKGTLCDDKGVVVAYKYSLPSGGEVVIANEDSVSPVFMYTETGAFDPKANKTAEYLFNVFVNNIKCARDANKTPNTGWTAVSNQAAQFRALGARASAVAQSTMGPFLTTSWSQGNPYYPYDDYNAFCPYFDVPVYGRFYSYTGCVATAMAQIMNYWKAPISGQGSSGAYDCTWTVENVPDPNDPNKTITLDLKAHVPSVNFASFSYDWLNMPEPDIQTNYNYTQISAVAMLMFHCGAAVHMQYTPEGSGAYVTNYDGTMKYCAENALKNNFKYQTAKGIWRDSYTREEWEAVMRDQILLSQPVLYSGVSPSVGGHAFVLDGMQGSPQGSLFHFNLGWGGQCDGWYTVDVLIGSCDPSVGGFADNQSAVVDIYTPDGPKKLTTLTFPEGSAAIVRSKNSVRFVKGAQLDLTVMPYPGYKFDHWEGALTGTDNPATIVMDSDKTATAVMVVAYRLNMQKDGEGAVTTDPNKEYYQPGEKVTVTAEPADGWAFDHWEGDATGTANPVTVTLNRESRVKAFFRQEYKLTIVRSGQGDVSRQPAQNSFAYGEYVTLNATPAQGWVFRQWSGDIQTMENPTMIRIDGDKIVKVEFVKMSESYRTLSVTNVGEGQVNPMNGAFPQDTKVILTAVPATGWKFSQWQGDVDTISDVNPLEITMNKDRGVTAIFVEDASQTPAHTVVQSGAPTTSDTTQNTTVTQSQTGTTETQKDSEFHFPNLINSCTLLTTLLSLAIAGGFLLLVRRP